MLTFPYRSFITEDDVMNNGGYRLSEVLIPDDTDNVEKTVANALREIARMIYDLLPLATRDILYNDPANEDVLARCQFYQMIYIIENGDLSSRNGVGDTAQLSLNDLRGWRNIAPSVYKELAAKGWLYRGVVRL